MDDTNAMTGTNERFLAACRVQAENLRGPMLRLYRLAERGEALRVALLSDPGHGVTGAVVRPTEDRTKSVSDWLAMGAALLAETGPFEGSVCRVCGCTATTSCSIAERAGPNSPGWRVCGWALEDRTLCGAPRCVEAAIAAGVVADMSGNVASVEHTGQDRPETASRAPFGPIAGPKVRGMSGNVEGVEHWPDDPGSRSWRCVGCKAVTTCPIEPEECLGCLGRTFAGPLTERALTYPDMIARKVCDYCSGNTFYVGTDIATGARVEISCLYCNETGFEPASRGLSSNDPAR